MKLKDTLQIGHTDFPMRANLATKEVELQKEWEEADIYNQVQEKNADKTTFILHDGPPYANGKIHIGHAMNKVTKDFIVRYKSMTGYRAPYVPGWDTHGLPIETAMLKETGLDRKEIPAAEFRQMCEEYALKQVDGQREDFKRLGITGEWDNPYLTLTPEYEAQQLRVFGKMADRGLIYRGKQPVYWSPSSESSLAEAEVEYHDVVSNAIYVTFKVKDGKGVVSDEAELLAWTTTPWTLAANQAVAVGEFIDYCEIKVDGRNLVVAEETLDRLAGLIGWEDYEIINRFKGHELEYGVAQHPFYDRDSLIVIGHHVETESGTGLVHIAPGHGDEDYQVGLKYDLEIMSPIDDRGHFTDEAPGLEGRFYLGGEKDIMKKLEAEDKIIYKEKYEHSYPHDWRTKKPVIYRATPQWFASIDKIRDELLDAVENDVTWIHPSGQNRMHAMIADRGDWVISRQRLWGVPLPIFYAEDSTPILDIDVINHVADLVEEHGSNIWFEWDAKDLLPEGYTHEGSPNGEFTKETDIMDVWFDSGTSYAGVLMQRDYLDYPADLYLEGSDQYRGWFNSSFTTSIAAFDQSPYKAVLSQGFVNDGEGRKMSKSVGNVISPEEVTSELGADVIRLWVSSVDYESDVRISKDILKQVAESYRRIRNTIRFMLANVDDYDPEVNKVAYEDLDKVDQYMLAKFDILKARILDNYEKYEYSDTYRAVINFLTVDLSSFYLDFAKDVVYIYPEDSRERRAMQTVMYEILHDLIILLTPILVHTMEEAWKYLPGVEGFVQLEDMLERPDTSEAEKIVAEWELFFNVRSGIQIVLEEAKDYDEPIKKAFEASVTLYADQDTIDKLNDLADNLNTLLIVSQFEMKDYSDRPEGVHEFDGYAVEVKRAEGRVCERCRSVRTDFEGSKFENISKRCSDIIEEYYPEYIENPE